MGSQPAKGSAGCARVQGSFRLGDSFENERRKELAGAVEDSAKVNGEERRAKAV